MIKFNENIFVFFTIGIAIALVSCGAETRAANSILHQIEKETARLIELTKPSVVSISSKITYSYIISTESSSLPVFAKKGLKHSLSFRNVGSGIIFDRDGHIITKSDVVQDAKNIEVTLYNEKRYIATFVGFDVETGLAVIKIDEQGLIPARLGNSDEVKEGALITIIGNSFGVLPSVSLGIVNGIRPKDDLIQLSAFINPGNSGSPIINTNAEVIGIVAARVNMGNQIQGAFLSSPPLAGGIAYPINKIKKIAQDIIQNKDKKKGWLGVTAEDDRLAASGKVHITGVIENSPAEKAGLKPKDVLLKMNNTKLKNAVELMKFIENSEPGSIIQLTILRDDKIIPKEVTIGERPKKRGCFSPLITVPQPEIQPQSVSFLGVNELETLNALRERVQYLELELTKLREQLEQR